MTQVLINNSAIDLAAAAALMDDEIREELHSVERAEERENAALDWYNSAGKAAIIAYCAARGVDILVPGERRLVDGWEELAIELYQAQLFADEYCRAHAERFGAEFSAA